MAVFNCFQKMVRVSRFSMVFWWFCDVWCHLAHTSWNPHLVLLSSALRCSKMKESNGKCQNTGQIECETKRSDKRSDRISSKMLEYALIECETIEWHIKYQSICQLLAITRSIFVGTWYFARLIIIVIIAIISQPELCTILFDDVFLVTYDKDIDFLTRPWLLWPAACYITLWFVLFSGMHVKKYLQKN